MKKKLTSLLGVAANYSPGNAQLDETVRLLSFNCSAIIPGARISGARGKLVRSVNCEKNYSSYKKKKQQHLWDFQVFH